jgi:hypothetical protein
MTNTPITVTVVPGTTEHDQWLADLRKADTCLQTRILDSHQATRARAIAAGDRSEPIPTGTTFVVIEARKLRPDEQ